MEKYNIMTVLNSDYFPFGVIFINSLYGNLDLEKIRGIYIYDTGLTKEDKEYLCAFPLVEIISTGLNTRHRQLHDDDWCKTVYSKTMFLMQLVQNDPVPAVMIDSDCCFLGDFAELVTQDVDFLACKREKEGFAEYIGSFFAVLNVEKAAAFINEWRQEIFWGTENHKESPALSRLINRERNGGQYRIGHLPEEIISCVTVPVPEHAKIFHMKSQRGRESMKLRINQPELSACINNYLVPEPLCRDGQAAVSPNEHGVFSEKIAQFKGNLYGDETGSIPDGNNIMKGKNMNDITNTIHHLTQEQRAFLAQRLLEKENIKRTVQKISPRPRTGASETFPLSFGQERLWLLNRLENESPAYNVASGFLIEGVLDVALLGKAVQRLVRQQEILRTVFREEEDQPRQYILPGMEIPLEHVDLTRHDREKAGEHIAMLVRREKARLFDLENGPLLRLTVITKHASEHVLLVHMHHIISDAWSLRLFTEKLIDGYYALSHGREPELAPLPIQYADYSAWQRESLSAGRLESLAEFWKGRLSGAHFVFEMPLDFPRPPVQTFDGEIYRFEADEILSRKMLDFDSSASQFAKLLTLFNILLFRYAGQNDILVGSPVWNRYLKETEELFGFFVNTLVFRNSISDMDSFASLLEKTKAETLEAYQHMDMPFEHLVKILNIERDFSRNPIFQISLNVYNQPIESKKYDDLKMENMSLPHQVSLFDLTLNVRVRDEKLMFWFEYNKNLFLPDTIKRLAGYFISLASNALANPMTPVSMLDYISSEEKKSLLDSWNKTGRDYHLAQCAHEIIGMQAKRTPDAPAVISDGCTLRYGELEAQSNQFSRYLQSAGITAGASVGVFMEKTPRLMVVLLGIWKSGCHYIPLDPSYPRDRLEYIVQDSKTKLVITDAVNAGRVFGGVSFMDCEKEWERILQISAEPVSGLANHAWPAYCIYTSGSTGKPKGVLVPHQALVNFLFAMQEYDFIGKDELLLSVTPLSFDISILELFLPLTVGAAAAVIPQSQASDPVSLCEALARFKPQVMQATPATWYMLLESGFQGDKRMVMLCGGEALSGDLAEKLLSAGGALWNMYGPTETTIWSCVHRVTHEEKSMIPIGRPIANTEIYILDRAIQIVPAGAIGDLYIGGKGLALGYHGLAELTRRRFIDHPFSATSGERIYKTGDLARYRCDGVIEYCGRSDFQVKVRGFRIELGEIEAALQRHPDVNQAVVIVHGDKPENKMIIAYVKPQDKKPVIHSELKLHLEKTLPVYMIPNLFVEMESFPLTPNGKTDRRALEQREIQLKTTQEEYVPPATEIEEILVDMWRELLQKDNIGVMDNFFLLGGHSLLAVKAVSRIRDSFEIELPLRIIFTAPTIQALAQHINAILMEELAKMDEAEVQSLLDK